MSNGHGVSRNVNYRERAGATDEYPILKEHLDFILDGIRHMPDPGKIIEPLGWFVMGIAGTAALEAYNADPGTDHRHYYVVVAVSACLAGLVCLFCDRKVNKEERKHASWLEKYVVDLYEQFGLEPPSAERHWFRKACLWVIHGGRTPEKPKGKAKPKTLTKTDGLVITAAIYGIGTDTLDAKDTLTALISEDDVLDFIADNTTLGGDPAPGVGKILRLRWTYNGKADARAFNEGTHIVIPPPGEVTP